ncbi:MAG: DNA translocase FtsK [Treponema sp.]|nr:MAG: DNA translocase FtsK [Treponema sp.]
MPASRTRRLIASVFSGSILFLVSAYLTISLLISLIDPSMVPLSVSGPGTVLLNVYGFSSFLVPAVTLWASLLLLIPAWSFRSTLLLSFSAVYFLTVLAAEKSMNATARFRSDSNLSGLITAGIIVTMLLSLVLEVLVVLLLADRIEQSRTDSRQDSDTPEVEFELPDDIDAEIEPDEAEYVDEPEPTDAGDATLAGEPAAGGDATLAGEPTDAGEPAAGAEAEDPLSFVGRGAPNRDQAEIQYEYAYSVRPIEDLPEHIAEDDIVQPDEADAIFALADDGFELPEDDAALAEDGEVPVSAEPSVSAGPSDLGVAGKPAAGGLRAAAELKRAALAEDSVEADFMLDEIFDDLDGNDDDLDETDDPVDDDPGVVDFIVDDAGLEDDSEFDAELPDVVSIPPAPRSGELTGTEVVLDSGKPGLFGRKKRQVYSVPFDILTSYPDGEYWVIDDATRRSAVALKETLNEFRIQADVTGIRKGPVITMFEILPAPGVKLSRIVGLQDNIALRLAASSVRIVAPIPGKHAVGIEVPNARRAIVSFRELIESDIPQSKKMEIPVVLGKDITGEAQLLDLASTPHLLIAGSTGSGKSVCVNSIILSILYKRSPEDVKLILIDPKIVELKLYNDIGHLLSPVITEPKKAFQALQYCLCEMERRYALLDGMGVRDIKSYNRRIKERNIATEKLPYLVVIIDEFADLMATTGKELESTVARLCAMSRAVGIHLVLATQRPSIDVITGLIKANIPTRIAFMVASKMDSRIIIDQVGAEKLLGRGDMLYASATDPFPVRIQGAFVSEEEVERVVEHVKTLGEPEYIDEEIFVEDDDDSVIDASLFSDGEDPLYEKALEIVLLAGKASASYIQRKLKIGYNRAARLVEDMEARGIVGPANGSKPRDVIHHP